MSSIETPNGSVACELHTPTKEETIPFYTQLERDIRDGDLQDALTQPIS